MAQVGRRKFLLASGALLAAPMARAQPMRIDLVINLKTARTLGLKLPYAQLIRAERVIE